MEITVAAVNTENIFNSVERRRSTTKNIFESKHEAYNVVQKGLSKKQGNLELHGNA
jgi:hypothetical protein